MVESFLTEVKHSIANMNRPAVALYGHADGTAQNQKGSPRRTTLIWCSSNHLLAIRPRSHECARTKYLAIQSQGSTGAHFDGTAETMRWRRSAGWYHAYWIKGINIWELI